MSDSDKIKLTVLPTETMHADLTWLLINPANMATKDYPTWLKLVRSSSPVDLRDWCGRGEIDDVSGQLPWAMIRVVSPSLLLTPSLPKADCRCSCTV